MRSKALKWLRKFAGDKQGSHGEGTAIANATGLNQGYVSRLLTKIEKQPAAGWDPLLSTLEEVAAYRRAHFNEDRNPWQILLEIDGEAPVEKPRAIPIEERWLHLWRRLFRGNPQRAERVLENLRLQEELGYTELISKVVHEILTRTPAKADLTVGQILRDYADAHKETAKQRRIRERAAINPPESPT